MSSVQSPSVELAPEVCLQPKWAPVPATRLNSPHNPTFFPPIEHLRPCLHPTLARGSSQRKRPLSRPRRSFMKQGFTWNLLTALLLILLLTVVSRAQQNGQASQPASGSIGPGQAGVDLPPPQSTGNNSVTAGDQPTANTQSNSSAPKMTAPDTSADDNPYDPVLEPPPLPKSKTTLIGG